MTTQQDEPAAAGDTEAEKARVRAKFETARGFWDPLWDPVLDADPNLLDAYIDLSSVPWQDGTLSPKERELVYVAMNASTTHLYEIGVRVHLRNAIGYGATPAEAMAVLAVVSEVGGHTVMSVLPLLADELAARPGAGAPATAPGPWPAAAEALAPRYLAAARRYSEVTRERGVLREPFRLLVAVAAASSATHLHLPAVQHHIRAALDGGVEWHEIVEVLEVVAMVGVHTLTEYARVVAEEFADRAEGTGPGGR
ncbi:carboxymuconolactone decarboxylase family protein [Pseudonocardia sp. HH130630-07]|uniref:carboxymuconolactone decarboxylase family protein n=1 Tax=Pseudonocardia sp. HH130630-07 TaxID=1690815 RepID=UPI000839D5B2|nr:carboxymuconolactone decarboxylase family protein [Pseudonocardia sp. HH130630-07]